MTGAWGVACCPRCYAGGHHDIPLISTMAWVKYEFVCLDCGGLFGFLDPSRAIDDEVATKRLEAYQAEWDTNVAGKLLTKQSMALARPEQKALHVKTLEWLENRLVR